MHSAPSFPEPLSKEDGKRPKQQLKRRYSVGAPIPSCGHAWAAILQAPAAHDPSSKWPPADFHKRAHRRRMSWMLALMIAVARRGWVGRRRVATQSGGRGRRPCPNTCACKNKVQNADSSSSAYQQRCISPTVDDQHLAPLAPVPRLQSHDTSQNHIRAAPHPCSYNIERSQQCECA